MASGIECVCASFISLTPFRPVETEARIAKKLGSGENCVRSAQDRVVETATSA